MFALSPGGNPCAVRCRVLVHILLFQYAFEPKRRKIGLRFTFAQFSQTELGGEVKRTSKAKFHRNLREIKFSASISAETLSCGSIWHVTEKIPKNKSSDLYADSVFKDYSAVRLNPGLHVAASCCSVVAPVPVLSERKRSPVGVFKPRVNSRAVLTPSKRGWFAGRPSNYQQKPQNPETILDKKKVENLMRIQVKADAGAHLGATTQRGAAVGSGPFPALLDPLWFISHSFSTGGTWQR